MLWFQAAEMGKKDKLYPLISAVQGSLLSIEYPNFLIENVKQCIFYLIFLSKIQMNPHNIQQNQ